MQAEVIVALVVGAFSFAGTAVGGKLGVQAANKLTCYRIEELEKKVDKHNEVIERTTDLEGLAKLTDSKIDANYKQLDEKIEAKCDLVDQRFHPIEQALSL